MKQVIKDVMEEKENLRGIIKDIEEGRPAFKSVNTLQSTPSSSQDVIMEDDDGGNEGISHLGHQPSRYG